MIFLEWEGIEDDFDEDFLFDCFNEELCDEKCKKHVFYTIFTSISPRPGCKQQRPIGRAESGSKGIF